MQRLPTNKIEALRLLKRTALRASALIPQTIVQGNVVRVRALYMPKVGQVDAGDGKDLLGISYMRVLKRVIILEGWKGLLRGIVSLAVATLITFLCSPRGAVVPFYPVLDAMARYCLLVLVDVPLTIFFVRSITTPKLLPLFGIRRAVRTLLSPAERRRPWLLYLTPGLFLVIALERAWDILLIPDLIKLVSRRVPIGIYAYGMSAQTIARLLLVFFHTAVSGPLEVVKVRLADQRYEQPIMLSEGQPNDSGVGDDVHRAEASETVSARVLRLRTDSDKPAYTSLFNCVRSIMDEEGFETLYRAWWFTLLVALAKFGVIKA